MAGLRETIQFSHPSSFSNIDLNPEEAKEQYEGYGKILEQSLFLLHYFQIIFVGFFFFFSFPRDRNLRSGTLEIFSLYHQRSLHLPVDTCSAGPSCAESHSVAYWRRTTCWSSSQLSQSAPCENMRWASKDSAVIFPRLSCLLCLGWIREYVVVQQANLRGIQGPSSGRMVVPRISPPSGNDSLWSNTAERRCVSPDSEAPHQAEANLWNRSTVSLHLSSS